MKKIFKLFLCLSMVFSLAGCEEIDHPIAGHTYSTYGGSSIGSMSVYIHFATNGSFDIDYMTKTITGYDHDKFEHFKWKVDGNKITITHDNSTYWKASVRGTLYETGMYNPSDKSVTLGGTKYDYSY